MYKRLLIIGLLVFAGWHFWLAPPSAPLSGEIGSMIDSPAWFDPEVSIDVPPLQRPVETGAGPLSVADFQLSPVAEFQLEARVLGRRDYRYGTESQLSPVDLALGWGPMARDDVLQSISIRQSNRFYYWSTKEFPIPRREIEHNSANMHLIPAGKDVLRELNRVREGSTVRLRGYLVDVERSDGWRWRTSTTRTDTGNGACEIVLVTLVSVL